MPYCSSCGKFLQPGSPQLCADCAKPRAGVNIRTSTAPGKRRRWWPVLLLVGIGAVIAFLLAARSMGGRSSNWDDSLPAWSPDGARITFSSNRYRYLDIFVMRADGSAVVQLTSDPFSAIYLLRSPTDVWSRWSPDGRRIAFASGRDNSYMASVAMNIYLMDPDGSHVIRLTRSRGSSNQPAWSPDGRRIAFTSNRDFDFHIYAMDWDGSNVIRLTDTHGTDDQPTWSPDGHRIAFTSKRDGNTNIYVMDADGTNVVQLTTGQNEVASFMAAWSPDGRRIAFASNRDGKVNIYTMAPDGSDVVQLTNTNMNTMPAWSPDGRRIAFTSDREFGRHIYAMEANGSNVLRLTHN